jgi:hypothetical protein
MENSRAHFNTLPASLVHRILIGERRMRHPPRPPINLVVKTLDQKHLRRRLSAQVKSLIISVRSDRVRLPSSVGID